MAHGNLAREYLLAVEHVVGRQDGIRAIAIAPDDDRNAKQAEICDAADAADKGKGVIIVIDTFGGSPSNLSLRACSPDNRRILYRPNLPTLINLVKSLGKSVPDQFNASTEAATRPTYSPFRGQQL